MKIVFAGTPEFAKTQVKALIDNGFKIDLVLTQPDRPAGRGQKLTPSAVKVYAQEQGLNIEQPTSLKDADTVQMLRQLKPDLMIVSAYGMLLPQTVLDIPKHGCWNVHASLLPRWRGAAPIHYAIWKGDQMTGISLMQMEAGLDSGPVLLSKSIDIKPDDTTGSLLPKLGEIGAQLLIKGLNGLAALTPIIQDKKDVTLCPKISKEQAQINWQNKAIDIERQIRALNPAPGCFSFLDDERIKILESTILTEHQANPHPGEIVHVSMQGIDVMTQDGLIQITKVQRPGKKAQTIGQILNAQSDIFKVGQQFNEHPSSRQPNP
jgi:methionyl-tRNA formyltransferase